MKSRFSLRTPCALQLDATKVGRPVVARAGEVSLARRFELKHNTSPRFARRRQERRKGQALLLAVLIMLLAALLSAGFLAVVSGNLNQTARIADKTKAIEASRAGIAFANAQLSGSANGDIWRPVDVSPAPVAANFNNYYSQLDRVQGWTYTRPVRADYATGPVGDAAFQQDFDTYRNRAYAKFPAPGEVSGDSPKFSVKVREVPADPADPDYEAKHVGEIKITSIGLSDDDPNVFHRSVAYKNGRRKSPWASALRSVSNWDFDKGAVPQVTISTVVPDATTGTTKVTFLDSALQATFPAVPFNVVLSHKDAVPANSSTFGGVVVSTAATTIGIEPATEYTVSGVAPTNFVANDTMQVAAALGTAQTIDLLNSGDTPTFPLFPTQEQPRGILANGSLWLQGQYQLTGLQKTSTKIQSSGAVFLSGSTAVTGQNPVEANGDVATGGDLFPSSNVNFPGDFTATAGVQKTDLVNDAWNKLGAAKPLGLDYSGDQTRVVEPFTPVKIDSAENLARYRALTRNADSDSTGNKLGVYIDNREDVEKVGTAVMTQADFLKMLTSDATTPADSYLRNAPAVPAGTIGSSLEQKHLRGWISPDEFMARGALVELSPDADLNGNTPSLRVTLDPRSDSVAAAPNNDVGPDSNKAARGANGQLRAGVYTQILPWPKNGTLFAEGNIRIRGKVSLGDVPAANAANFPSLTVVSLGNIYIEGSVSVDGPFLADGVTPNTNRKKLMLLAKKNVVVNPTRLVTGHVDVQTVTRNAVDLPVVARTALDVPVEDSNQFVSGDVVELGGSIPTAGVRAIVTATDTTAGANTITVFPLDGSSIPATTGIRTQIKDAREIAASTVKYFVADATNAINRRVLLQNAQADYPNLRLALDHEAERKTAFTVETEDYGNIGPNLLTKPADLEVKVTNKRVDANATLDRRQAIVERADKRLRATFNLPAPAGVDSFPDDPTDAAFTDATARAFSLESLETTMNAVSSHVDIPNLNGWKYTATKDAALPVGVPTFFLTAVGLRYNQIDASGVPDYGIEDIGPNGSRVEMPLATSVILARGYTGSGGQGLFATHTDTGGVIAEYRVDRFGFNPDFGVTNPSVGGEDILTVDQSFYQTDANALNSTLDSRRVQAGFDTGVSYSFRQNLDNLLLPATITPPDLPAYRVRALKLENTLLPAPATVNPLVIRPVDLNIDAFVYAQEGSWLMIPGGYFRDGNPVRSNAAGTATYIDGGNGTAGTANNGVADVGEYVNGTNVGNDVNNFDAGDFADLNRNGIEDPGEAEAALRFVRYNYTVNFYGAIIENQTPVVADVEDAAGTTTLAQGAVQNWMNKWASYDSTVTGANPVDRFRFITYTYDPAILNSSTGANELRIPVTDDLIYQQ